ncbi:MAG: type II toxin-antitoxin system RelE/ParE family toxin [Clostridiales bacterium]|jgi:toxin ParE1/3/4|nr:type II toxin-antitoxin system RelE/ParE family toxin [Clostridiales bacterium]
MIWTVQYTDSAEQDLQGIYDYISDVLLVPETAEKQTERILDAAESLEHMPYRHRLCDYEPWRSRGWRVMPVDNANQG